MNVLVVSYVTVLALLFVYGANCYVMAFLRLRSRARPGPPPALAREPMVTVQLPIFNEEYVLPRLLEAACALDWPRDKLEVQVLDDSTDDTRALAELLAAEWRARGVEVQVLHRENRRGFKAGALAAGLAEARGDVIAIFDADFVPPPDFLRKSVPHLMADASVACVQTRWGHVNEDYSLLTRAQAVGIDGHFAVEQHVRSERGLLMNFNGTAGVWRASAIRDAGGWTADTLAEDLDLSYRAQLKGWRFRYLPDVATPAEVPTQVHAFKRQQARWAQGSIQCLRKHWRAVLRSERLRPGAKAEALLHLSHYFVHPLMLMLSILLLGLAVTGGATLPIAALFFGATFGPPVMYLVAQRALHPRDWVARLPRLVPLTLLGVGIAASNTAAVWRGLTRDGGEFRRTPKFRIERSADSWRDKRYALPLTASVVAEGALALLMTITVAIAVAQHRWTMLPWATLFGLSYATVFVLSMRHHIRPARPARGVAHAALDAP